MQFYQPVGVLARRQNETREDWVDRVWLVVGHQMQNVIIPRARSEGRRSGGAADARVRAIELGDGLRLVIGVSQEGETLPLAIRQSQKPAAAGFLILPDVAESADAGQIKKHMVVTQISLSVREGGERKVVQRAMRNDADMGRLEIRLDRRDEPFV